MIRTSLFKETKSHILGAKTYPKFRKTLASSDCQSCPLSEKRHNIVVDRGNPDTDVLIIGEGPGENEDLQGQAFVGRAGKLLDSLLKDLGFDTNQDSLIANIVKCRPPGNRRPKQEEVDACFPYLRKQIALIRPKIILLLGATAFKHMIKGKSAFSMAREAGNFFEYPDFSDIKFMVLYHPAFILRDPRKKPVMVEHLKRFKGYWDKQREQSV
jgi:DNA polymerase